jgi:hypothetical protein
MFIGTHFFMISRAEFDEIFVFSLLKFIREKAVKAG